MKKENVFNKKKLWVYVLLGVIAVILVIVYLAKRDEKTSRDIFYSMDTTVTIKLWGEKDASYKKLVEKLDGLWDCYDKDSEIYKLNKNGETKISAYTRDILTKAKKLCEKHPECDITAGGLIDLWDINGTPQVPDESEISAELERMGVNKLEISDKKAEISDARVNLGSCAKGYACDLLREMLVENGEKCAVVSFGSSSLLFGKKPDGENFTVAVNNPLDKEKSLGTLELGEAFVSTSGGYERYFEYNGEVYSHIFDLKTGYPAKTDLLSVTVIGKSGIETDFLSTCLYIKGTDGVREFCENKDNKSFSVVAVSEDGKIYISEGLKGRFSLENKDFTIEYI